MGPTMTTQSPLNGYSELATLPPEIISRMLASSISVEFSAGQCVFDEHATCAGFPFVEHGAIRVIKASSNGRELPLYYVRPGETCIISTSCLLGGHPYNAQGVAVEDSQIRLLPPPVFDELLSQPDFRRFVFHIVAERMAELMQLVEEVAFKRLDQRLASLLIRNGPTIRSTHQQLADELGSVREIVSRLLKGFAEQGAVRLAREQISIIDAKALQRIEMKG